MRKFAYISSSVLLIAGLVLFTITGLHTDGKGKPVIKLKVTGMHCAACVVSVQQSLKKVPGVEKVRIDAARAEARITLRDSTTDPQVLIGTVRKAGFSAQNSKE